MQAQYDFFVWSLAERTGDVYAQLRKGETIVFTLRARADSEQKNQESLELEEQENNTLSKNRNLAEWEKAWEEFIQKEDPSIEGIIKHIRMIKFEEDVTDTFASSYERYIWITVVIALLSYLRNNRSKKIYKDLEFNIHSYLESLWKRPETLFFTKKNNAIKKAIWHDMKPFVEFGIIVDEGHKENDGTIRKQIKRFLEKFIRQTRREHKKSVSYESHFLRGLLQLYATSLIFSVNTSNLGKVVNQIFRLDEEVIKSSIKKEKLTWVVKKVEELEGQTHNRESRQAILIHAIGDNYFRNYDVDSALAFWELLAEKPFPLNLLIKVYHERSPYVLAGSWIVASLLLWLEIKYAPEFVKGVASVFAVFTLLLLFRMAFSFIRNRGFVFGHLFLQRLVGASIVGLSLLAVTPEGWRIALCNDCIPWSITVLSTFFLAWSSLFFRIYRDSVRSGYNFAIEKKPLHKKVFSISSKILAIHTVFTLIIVFLVSGFLAHILIPELTQQCLDSNQIIPPNSIVWGYLKFGFSPKLILLWTGISIFIGNFVQLLWDEHEVTSV